MKKLLAILLASLMLLLASCGGDNGASTSSADDVTSTESVVSSEEVSSAVIPAVNDYGEYTYNFTDIVDYLKLDGRWAKAKTGLDAGSKPCITYDHTGQLLAFNADCEGDVVIKMAISPNTRVESATHYFLIYVDGEEQERASVTALVGVETLVDLKVATGLTRGSHSFKIYRESELNWGTESLVSMTIHGVPTEKPADSELYIEFLGDSITAGYGNLTTRDDTDNASAPPKSDGTQTYAFKTAQNLGADFSAVCQSGLAYSYGLELPIEDYFNDISWRRPKLGAYDFSRKADVVVINLGTNDHNNYANKGLTLDDMHTDAVSLLKLVREKCPDSKIVWVYGMMGNNLDPQISSAVEEVGGNASGFYYCPMGYNSDGGGYHPSAAAHTAAAKTLTDFIKGIL